MGFMLSRSQVNVGHNGEQSLSGPKHRRPFMPSSAHGVLELGAFIGRCQPVGLQDIGEKRGDERV